MPALPAIAVGASVVGLVMQASAMEDAKDARNQSAAESRAQFAAQQRIADIKNARERANLARQTRLARAQIVQTGANTGTSSSTGVMGGVASVGTQSAAATGIFGAIEANQADIISSQERQGQAQGDIAEAQAMFNLGTSVFNAGGGFKTIFDIGKK